MSSTHISSVISGRESRNQLAKWISKSESERSQSKLFGICINYQAGKLEPRGSKCTKLKQWSGHLYCTQRQIAKRICHESERVWEREGEEEEDPKKRLSAWRRASIKCRRLCFNLRQFSRLLPWLTSWLQLQRQHHHHFVWRTLANGSWNQAQSRPPPSICPAWRHIDKKTPANAPKIKRKVFCVRFCALYIYIFFLSIFFACFIYFLSVFFSLFLPESALNCTLFAVCWFYCTTLFTILLKFHYTIPVKRTKRIQQRDDQGVKETVSLGEKESEIETGASKRRTFKMNDETLIWINIWAVAKPNANWTRFCNIERRDEEEEVIYAIYTDIHIHISIYI